MEGLQDGVVVGNWPALLRMWLFEFSPRKGPILGLLGSESLVVVLHVEPQVVAES